MKKHLRLILLSIFLLGWVPSISREYRAQVLILNTGGFESFTAVNVQQNPEEVPSLPDFIDAVKNENNPSAVGVYLPRLFALPILQQPSNQPAFVSTKPESVTQFQMSAKFDNLGLLAHNYLSGAKFFQIEIGQPVYIVKGNGEVAPYTVSSIRRFQALQPESIYSDFLDLDKGGKRLTSSELFNLIYTKSNQVVFQTCIAKDGNASWGRIFVIATQTYSSPQSQINPSEHVVHYHRILGHIPVSG